jgi:hypothetical protein
MMLRGRWRPGGPSGAPEWGADAVDAGGWAAHDRVVGDHATCGSGAAACVAADRALAFVEGQVGPAERGEIEERIDRCARCRAAVAEAARRVGGELVLDERGKYWVRRWAGEAGPAPQRRPPAVTTPLRAQRPASAPIAVPRSTDRREPRQAASAPIRPADASPIGGDRFSEPPAGQHDAPATVSGRAVSWSSPGAALVDEDGGVVGAVRSGPPDAGRGEVGLVAGEVVGRYVVERPLGAGGMGVVSLARDPELRRQVVIKLVHPDVGASEGGEDFEARLRREAQAMAQVSHANVVQIFDIGRRGDRVFLAMEFIDGQTLGEWLRERSRTAAEILGVMRQAGAGLAAAHRAGLVHRDFKPSNVLVSREGAVKVTDFGLARSMVASGVGAASGTEAGADAGAGGTRKLKLPQRTARPSGAYAVLTEANAVLGTPAYMAPEQAAGQAVDARTDQYALAVTLLDALLGQSPSRRRVAPGDPPASIDTALAAVGVAPPVRAGMLRALAAEPAARFPAIDELLQVLAPAPGSAVDAAPAVRSRPGRRVAIGVALCAAAVIAYLVLGRGAAADCTAEAPGRWTDELRTRLVAALSAAPQPFAGWEAARVAATVDGSVTALAAAETARCRGEPVAGPADSAECVAQRSRALAAALAQLASASAGSGAAPPADAWSLLRAIERCDPPSGPSVDALRAELGRATPARVRQIAEAARAAADDRLTADPTLAARFAAIAADALEAAGLAALASGDAAAADGDFQGMATAGDRVGDDAVRGRALLHLLASARWRGDHDDGKRDREELDAMLVRHGEAPRDVVIAAIAAGEAFTDLGDVAAVFAAWDRARTAAATLGDRDAALAAAIGRAWSMRALRFDVPGARAAATAALAEGIAATPTARARALGIAADLAIAAHDGAAARAALDEAARLDPSSTALPAVRLRAQRTRALLGDIDGALSDLAAEPTANPVTAARIGLARGEILLADDHANEAAAVLDKLASESRPGAAVRDAGPRAAPAGSAPAGSAPAGSAPAGSAPAESAPVGAALPNAERIDLVLAVCEAQIALTGDCKAVRQIRRLVASLHPRAPARARLAKLEAATAPAESRRTRATELLRAIDILAEAAADPVEIALLRWQVAQLGVPGTDERGLATAARAALLAAGHTAEVSEIDRWLGETAATPSGAGSATSPPRREGVGPQP